MFFWWKKKFWQRAYIVFVVFHYYWFYCLFTSNDYQIHKWFFFFFNLVFGKTKKVNTASEILYFYICWFYFAFLFFIRHLVWMSLNGVFFSSPFCVISYVLRMWRQRHFSIFELLKSSFIEAEVSDVINYILIHVNSLKQKTMASF